MSERLFTRSHCTLRRRGRSGLLVEAEQCNSAGERASLFGVVALRWLHLLDPDKHALFTHQASLDEVLDRLDDRLKITVGRIGLRSAAAEGSSRLPLMRNCKTRGAQGSGFAALR